MKTAFVVTLIAFVNVNGATSATSGVLNFTTISQASASTAPILAAAGVAAASAERPAPTRPQLKLAKSDQSMVLRMRPADQPDWIDLLTYVTDPSLRPYLHPVRDASGRIVLTDNRPADHPWQHGIFTGFHKVNGFNYWKEDEGRQRFVRLFDLHEADGQVSWRALTELVDPSGRVVLEEEDSVAVYAPESPVSYTIDFAFLLRAKDRDVNFGKFGVGGLAVRMPWDQQNPKQTHLNSNGLRGRACEQKRAKWCNVERPFGGETFGIVILDHPSNPNHPSGWRVDEQGLINPAISMLGDWTLPAGKERSFRYRIHVYAGSRSAEELERRFEDFAATSASVRTVSPSSPK